MALTPGTRLGVYEITSLLGEGGMGQVYRATDTKLKRQVAIKILPPLLAGDPERLARFQREAEVLASLNHPNIAHIHGLEESGGTVALVMELVEGDDLSQRIARGAIPIDEALPIAKQIAGALEAAHEQGIIHRDLKPANIKVRSDGTVTVLDFGLAKVMDPARGSSPGMSMSPTLSLHATQAGIILGTAAYMSPEQARGKVVDKRADIWAFGCVLYEMLTGRTAFARDTVTDTLAAIVEREPDWTVLPAMTPPGVRRLLRWCLEKDLKRRLRDAADARVQVEDALTEPSDGAVPSQSSAKRARAWQLTSILVLAAAAIAIGSFRLRSHVEVPEMRLDIVTPPTGDPVSLAVSPDGSQVAFTASVDGQTRLWVRSMTSTEARALPGTDGAAFPFWSPDSRAIGFFAQRQLKRLDIESGAIQGLAAAEGGRGATWADDGTILFQPSPGVGPLFRVPARGGKAIATDTQYGRFPQFLPDQRHFLYFRPGQPDVRGVYVSQVEGGNGQRVLETEATAIYTAPGYLLFVHQGTLFAQPFDTGSFTLKGEPSALATGLVVNGPLLNAPVSTSRAGTIVYRAYSAGGLRQFVWFDRTGKTLSKVGDAVENLLQAEISPDGRRLALHRLVEGNTDIWMLDLARGLLTRFTSSPAVEYGPIWSPDGRQLAFSSSRNGPGDLRMAMLTGDAQEEVLLETPREKWPTDWSRDGRYLLYVERGNPTTGRDLWVLRMRDRKPSVVAQTAADEDDGQFSPDGNWIAYQSNESGRVEVYVVPFGRAGGKVLVSTTGGAQARWRRDGKVLYYVALDGNLMEVPIDVTPSGIEVRGANPLFPLPIGDPLQTNMRRAYIVADVGERFLVNTLTETAMAPITVVLNWKPKP